MKAKLLLFLALPAVLPACDRNDPDLPFGETAIAIVVNPVPNDGNTAAPPAFVSDLFGDIDIDADPGGEATTDVTGLAVLRDLEVGPTELSLEGVPLAFEVINEGDVYDLAVAFDGNQVAPYPGFPIQYSVGGSIIEIDNDDDANLALATDDTIVFFDGGLHVGDLSIVGSNVILFGEDSEEPVVIDGNLEVRGTNVRLRGVTITGDLSVFGNQFGMAFSTVRGNVQLNGQAISFLRNIFCNGATVPSSNAALFGNEGLAPLPAPAEPCQ